MKTYVLYLTKPHAHELAGHFRSFTQAGAELSRQAHATCRSMAEALGEVARDEAKIEVRFNTSTGQTKCEVHH